MCAEYMEIEKAQAEEIALLPELIDEIQSQLTFTLKTTHEMTRELIKSGYYSRLSLIFRCQVYEAILFFEATSEELQLFSTAGSRMVLCQLEMLDQLTRTATSLYTSLRFAWKTNSYPDDYSSECFLVLSDVYQGLADMFVALEKLETFSDLLLTE